VADEQVQKTAGATIRPLATERPVRQGFYDIIVHPYNPRYFRTCPPEGIDYWRQAITDVAMKIIDTSQPGRARYRCIDDMNPERIKFESPVAATEHVKRLALGFGADLVGVTIFKEEYCFTDSKPDGDYLVVMGAQMAWEAVSQAPGEPAGVEMARVYALVGRAVIALADAIRGLGYRARAHHPMSDDGKFNGGGLLYIPAAVDAGLGWMGKCTSMVTRQFGPRVRLGAVATDLPLVPDIPMSEGLCGDCDDCIRACPAKALWADSLQVMQRYAVDQHKFDRCRPFYAKTHGCAVCLASCPWSRRAVEATAERSYRDGAAKRGGGTCYAM